MSFGREPLILNDWCFQGRFTLLLGPPGSGKSTLLKALSGKLEENLRVKGEVTMNGHTLDEFVVQRTSGYIEQVPAGTPPEYIPWI